MKKLNYLTDSKIGKLFITLVPAFLGYEGLFKKFKFKKMSSEPIEIAATVIFALCIYIILTLIQHRNKIQALKEFRD